METVHITSLQHPELWPYRTLRRPLEHQQMGIFVAEGEKVVRRLLRSSLEVVSVLMTPEWFAACQPILEPKGQDLHAFVADKKLLDTIVGFHLHQGIMAVAKVPTSNPLENLLAKIDRPRLLVAVDGLTNAENLGVLVRNCAAFGAQAILVGETSGSPYLRRAVRNSMGTVFSLNIVHLTNLAQTLGDIRQKQGIRSIAADPHAVKKGLTQVDFVVDCCIVFGSEGEGISPGVLTACDEAVAIPMGINVDSLNVASASAVFLYEVHRQRGAQLPAQ